jgi:hypothetical protein
MTAQRIWSGISPATHLKESDAPHSKTWPSLASWKTTAQTQTTTTTALSTGA